MGIYIPNMEKPKNCRTCNFKSNKEGECWFVRYDIDCPLIEIIHCKDCKWFGIDDGMTFCNVWLREVERHMFCSYGERRE